MTRLLLACASDHRAFDVLTGSHLIDLIPHPLFFALPSHPVPFPPTFVSISHFVHPRASCCSTRSLSHWCRLSTCVPVPPLPCPAAIRFRRPPHSYHHREIVPSWCWSVCRCLPSIAFAFGIARNAARLASPFCLFHVPLRPVPAVLFDRVASCGDDIRAATEVSLGRSCVRDRKCLLRYALSVCSYVRVFLRVACACRCYRSNLPNPLPSPRIIPATRPVLRPRRRCQTMYCLCRIHSCPEIPPTSSTSALLFPLILCFDC